MPFTKIYTVLNRYLLQLQKGTCLSGSCNDGKCCRRFITLLLYQALYEPESTILWYELIRTQIYLISSYISGCLRICGYIPKIEI